VNTFTARLIRRVSNSGMRSPLLAIPLFWVAVRSIELLDVNFGTYRALVMLSVLLALLPLTRGAGRPHAVAGPKHERCLAITVGILVTGQVAYAVTRLWDPHLVDIATKTLAAGDALLTGANPYVLPIDGAPSAVFHGFKYSPLMAVWYMPLGVPLGQRGIVLTNLPLQLATVWLVFRLTRSEGARGTALVAVLAYLALPIVPFEIFNRGVPELVAVLPLLVALLYSDRNAWLAGFCIGVSLSAKLLPGGLLLPCCLPAGTPQRVRYAAGISIGLVPMLLAALWSPVELWNNLILFNLLRPVDSTSWLSVAPPFAGWCARGAFVVVFLCIAISIWRARTTTVAARCGFGAIAILAALLSGPVAHNNYHLWWLPLGSIVLANGLDRRRSDPALPAAP